MAIIYSYPVVQPTTDDLVLGTDATDASKPTKNFTVQSIIDLVTVSGNDLQAVLNNGNVATGKDINLTNNNFRGGSFITTGNATITGTTGSGFTQITADDFAGDLTGIVKAGSSIESAVTGVTQSQGDNSTKLATTAYVDSKVDPSVLQYLGDSTGPFDLNLVNDDFKIAGTANEIETTATTVAGNVGTVTLSFPTAGVTLPNGSVATTQALTDNSTKVATTAFVHGKNDAQTLNFSNGANASTVLLNSQTFVVSGTANQIATTTTPQTITIGLTTDVTIAGTYTGATFSGDLNGTVNTATTGTTQSAGDNSTKIATTAYVDNAAGAKILQYKDSTSTVHDLNLSNDDLQFNGDSNITVTAAAVSSNIGTVTVDLNNSVTISGTMQAGTLSDGTFSGTAGTYTGGVSITSTDFVGALTGNASTATALAASGAIALTGDTTSTGGPYTYTSGGALSIATTIADTTVTGKVLTNLPTATSQVIADSDTILEALSYLQGQITGIPQGLVYKGTWNASTNTPTLASGTGTTGEFYIVSVAGTTNLDGITDWQVGDWAIFVEVGATDTWQKIDNTSAILGSGTADKIAKWTGSNTLATGLISDDGTDVTIGNSGNLIVEGNTTLGNADTDTTTVKGPGVFEETAQFNVGIGLGATPSYGTAGQVLTSGGGSATANTWTTPTIGTVTSVTAGTGITIGGTAADPTVAIDTVGSNNAIEVLNFVTPTTGDFLWISDVSDSSTLKKVSVSDLVALDSARSLSAVLAVGNTSGTNDILMADNQAVKFGAGNDLQIYSDGTVGYIKGDDFRLVNALGENIFRVNGDIAELYYNDSKKLETTNSGVTVTGKVEIGQDLEIYHDGTNSVINNKTGDLQIYNNADDKDIVFISDDGSGGTTEYFRLDGSTEQNVVSKNMRFEDNIQAQFGAGTDLRIYHNGSNSFISDTGTGNLNIQGNIVAIESTSGENYFVGVENSYSAIYYDNSTRLQTTTTGVDVSASGVGNYGRLTLSDGTTKYGYVEGNTTEGLWLRGTTSGTTQDPSGIGINGYNTTFFGSWGGGVSGTVMKVEGFFPKVEIGDSTNFGNGNLTDLEVWGDVDVKGSITGTSSGVSSIGGRKFAYVSKALTTAGGWTDMFSITGVWIPVISEVFAQCAVDGSITKNEALSYHVAQAGGTSGSVANTPVYNKIIDTGPGSAASFELQFLAYNGGNNNHGYKCQARALTANSTVDISVNWMESTIRTHTFTDLT